MSSILFCSTCEDRWKCDGYINCPWLSPHDEANCSQQCPSSWFTVPCDCNKPGNMTCEGKVGQRNYVCYPVWGKLPVSFCKYYNLLFQNYTKPSTLQKIFNSDVIDIAGK